MFGKTKKPVSLAYRDKLLAEIAHYEKRIEEALNKRKQNCFEDESVEELITNPYKLNLQPSQYELKQREASLSERASMTLELAMLTIMQSEVNVMVTPPEVRKPVPEDGTWYEVAAECKIDLVPFTITFYAHKPHRRFAPTRYRNVVATPVKPAHEKELAQSILPNLHLPNLALQVLQSYATAFRSRRTTLLELAEKYADKLRMQAMPEGGYRIKFLELLQVDWTLENLWSPVVPFCHRMKFEVEYMPKDYIQAIGKLYKQFKDPTLGTSERTLALSRIFDICLQAAGPARELQESFESDPETAGRLHERRTTIDQEPDVPHVDQSPKKKEPSGTENKPQNRKTSMAPPKTIPKKAKRNKVNEKDLSENRKSVKRVTESDSGNVSKKSRVDGYDDSKSKPGLKGGRDDKAKNQTEDDGLEANDQNRDKTTEDATQKNRKNTVKAVNNPVTNGSENANKKSNKVNAKSTRESTASTATSDDVMKKRDAKTAKSKGTGKTDEGENHNGITNKDAPSSVSEASSKGSKKGDAKTNDKVTKNKEINTENNAARTKRSADNLLDIENDKNTVKTTNSENNVKSSKKSTGNKASIRNQKTTEKDNSTSKDIEKEKELNAETAHNNEAHKVTSAKDKGSVAISKHGAKKSEFTAEKTTSNEKYASENAVAKSKASNKENGKNAANTKENGANDKLPKTKHTNDTGTFSKTSSKTVASNDDGGKTKATKKLRDTYNMDTLPRKVVINSEKDTNGPKKIREMNENNKVVSKPTQKDSTAKQKVGTSDATSNNKNKLAVNKEQTVNKVVEQNKVVKGKQTEVDTRSAEDDVNKGKDRLPKKTKANVKNPEHTDLDKNEAVDKTTTKVIRTQETHKNEPLAKNPESAAKHIKNNNEGVKKITTNIEKPRNSTKTLNTTRVLQGNTNRDATETNVAKQTKKTNNLLNFTVTKSKIIPISKLQAEKQAKIADKLKTKIPMLKSKMTFSSLGDKLKNLGKISKGIDKTKIPQNNLPVFKRIAKNVPTRASPRKQAKVMPSAHGFSNK